MQIFSICSTFYAFAEGAAVFAPNSDEPIGNITSGIPSPTLSKNIAMGYIKSGYHKKGTEVMVEVRKKMRKATVTPMPYVLSPVIYPLLADSHAIVVQVYSRQVLERRIGMKAEPFTSLDVVHEQFITVL